MNRYFSIFISGFKDPIEDFLKHQIYDIEIELLLDGLVVYTTKESSEKIGKLRFFNNSFVLLDKSNTEESLEKYCRQVLKNSNIFNNYPHEVLKTKNNFRVIFSNQNQMVSVEKHLMDDLESVFAGKLRLKVNRSLPDIEFWFVERSEGYYFLGVRLTTSISDKKLLRKGELRPELAHIMCLLADLKSSDTVLDPFAGHGSIPMECAKFFKVSKIIAGEKDRKLFQTLQDKTVKYKNLIQVKNWDALNLKEILSGSIDKIITDPPWGLFDPKIDISDFCQQMFVEFKRIIKPDGLIVLLSSQKELIESLITKFGLKISAKYDILVSGKKAGIYKISNI